MRTCVVSRCQAIKGATEHWLMVSLELSRVCAFFDSLPVVKIYRDRKGIEGADVRHHNSQKTTHNSKNYKRLNSCLQMSRYLIIVDINYSIGIFGSVTRSDAFMLYETSLNRHWCSANASACKTIKRAHKMMTFFSLFFCIKLKWFGGANFNQNFQIFSIRFFFFHS